MQLVTLKWSVCCRYSYLAF